MRWLAPLVLVAVVVTPALAQDSGSAPKKKRDPNLITLEEIETVRAELANAHEIVSRLRPQFLRGRGANSFGNAAGGRRIALPRVVLDGSPYGELNSLSQISSMVVREIRFLGSGDASIKFGTNYDGGAIVVSTR